MDRALGNETKDDWAPDLNTVGLCRIVPLVPILKCTSLDGSLVGS